MATLKDAVSGSWLSDLKPLSDGDVAFRVGLLAKILKDDDGIGQVKRLLTDRAKDFGGVVPAQHMGQVLLSASVSGLGGREAARLAVCLSEVKSVCSMDVEPYLRILRERFPVECEEGNLLAVEVMEA